MQIIELSQTITQDMPLFSPKWPKPIIEPWMSHAQAATNGIYQDCTCEVTQVQFVTSLGTYMDSPYHFNPAGKSIEGLSIEQLVLPAITVDCTYVQPRQAIEPTVLDSLNIQGKAVLFHTGWSQYWGQPEYYEYPFLSGATAIALRDRGAKLAGMDFLAADDNTNPRRPAHVTLLHNNILIVENLTNLAALPRDGFIFHAAPPKITGAAAFPVRAYAVIL